MDYRPRKGRVHNASLDRIDSKKDYIVGNVQWVHKNINKLKRDFEQNYLIKLCTAIALHMKGTIDEKKLQNIDT